MDKNKKVSFDIIVYSMMIVAVIYAIVQSLSGHNNEIYYTVKDISLSNEYIVWFSPNIKVKEKTNKVSIVLYENNIILELVLNI